MENDDPLTSRAAADLAEALAGSSEVAGLPVTLLGSGTDHVAFDVGGRFVFRVPQSEEAALASESEHRLTAMLASELPVAIPRFRFVAGATSSFPFGFSGYERLPGTPSIGLAVEPTCLREIARSLGGLLRVLHDVDVSRAVAIGVPADDDPQLEAWSAQAVEDVDRALGAGAIDPAISAALRRYLGAPPAARYVPCVVHGDLAAEHVLLGADGTVTGVIDWSDAMIGDRALDLAGLVHWGGEEMLAAGLETYGACDEATLARARWFAACRAVADVCFGLDEGRPQYVAAGRHALAYVERALGPVPS